MEPERIVIQVKPTNRNDGQGRTWHGSHRERATMALLVPRRAQPFAGPVRLTLVRRLGLRERLWDADSIGRGNAKQLIDALVGAGWLHDDGPKFVSEVDYRQNDNDRANGPAWVVIIQEKE